MKKRESYSKENNFHILECAKYPDTTQLFTTSNLIGPWYHAALLFLAVGFIVLLFVLSFSQQIREDLVRAAYELFRKL